MLAWVMSSAATRAPGASFGSSSFSTGTHRSFQPSSSTSSIGPGTSASVSSASPGRIVTASPTSASSRLARAAAAFFSLSSVVKTRPAPLSVTAAAR
jgi:hypothetical protein